MANPAARATSSSVQHVKTETDLIISASCERPRDYQSIEREPAPQRAAPPEETAVAPVCKKYFQKGTCWEHVIYLLALSVASYAGVIARIYLAKLSQWDGVALFPSLYAEMVGTAIMGFIISHKRLLEKNHSAVYQAIATGLCGSITTFSSWNSEATTVLIQENEYPPDNAQRMISWVTILLLGFGMPVASLFFGKHLAYLSPWCDRRLGDRSENEEAQFAPRGCPCRAAHWSTAESVLIVALWVFSTVLVTFLPFYFNQSDLMFSCVFSFAGTYTRWHLAPLNAVFKDFKLGTFLVNVLGSWILGAMLVLKKHFGGQLDELGVAALTGVTTGFCGCLTTVSTFAVELTSISLRGAYIYGLCSVVLAQLGLVIIRGVYLWTKINSA